MVERSNACNHTSTKEIYGNYMLSKETFDADFLYIFSCSTSCTNMYGMMIILNPLVTEKLVVLVSIYIRKTIKVIFRLSDTSFYINLSLCNVGVVILEQHGKK